MSQSTASKKGGSSAKKLTPFQQECLDVLKQVNEYKLIAEANAVSIIYKRPELIKDTSLKLDDINNNAWRVYFNIANDIINVEKKNTLDEITINMYLEKHPKLKEKYEEYDGYSKIEASMSYIQEDNFDSYVSEIKKWNAVVKLAKIGFPVKDRLSEFVDAKADDIYNELEAVLNHTFINVESDIKTYNPLDGLYDFIDDLNKGSQVGMPMSGCKILSREIGGINFNGNIYGLGANSGVGKSTLAINYLMPAVISQNEKMVMMINEEDVTKVQRELLIWVCNNVIKAGIRKVDLRDGNFSEEQLNALHKAADYLDGLKQRRNITVVPFEKYTAKAAIKVIKKYSSMGVRLFVLDTLKESSDSRNLETWKSMERDMVDLYDVVKPAAKNVALFVTYQLGKASVKLRYLTNNEIGQAKNILDVFSVNLMMRRPFDDEFINGSHELKCYKISEKSSTKIPFKLNREKHYMITFITKNRFGITDQYQIVSECNLSTNEYKDVGICNIAQDW